MYTAVLLILLALAGWQIFAGLETRTFRRIVLGVLIGVFTLLFFWFIGFWGEKLWFEALGYNDRFWKEILAKLFLTIVGAAFGAAVVGALTLAVDARRRYVKHIAWLLGALIAGTTGPWPTGT